MKIEPAAALAGIATVTAAAVVAHHCHVLIHTAPGLVGQVTAVGEPKLGKARGEADVSKKY